MKILSSIFIAFIYLSLLYICVIMFSAHGMHTISLNDIYKRIYSTYNYDNVPYHSFGY